MTARSAVASPGPVRTLALAIIATHLIGVLANAASLAMGDQTYPAALWGAFLLLKLAGFVSGILLLLRRRLGAWLFAASLVAGTCVALICTGPYPAPLWVAAGSVTLVVALTVWLMVRREWERLR